MSRLAPFGYLGPGSADRYRLRSLRIFGESVRDAQLAPVDTQTASADLDGRIGELDESIGRLERTRSGQVQRLERLRQDKRQGDRQLATVLTDYDSAVLARARAMERDVARLRERSRSLEQTNRVRVSAARLRRQHHRHHGDVLHHRRRQAEHDRRGV